MIKKKVKKKPKSLNSNANTDYSYSIPMVRGKMDWTSFLLLIDIPNDETSSILDEDEIVEIMNDSSQGLLYKSNTDHNQVGETDVDIWVQILDKIDNVLKEYPYQKNIHKRVKYFTPQRESDLDFSTLSKANVIDLRIDPVKQLGLRKEPEKLRDLVKQKNNILQVVRMLGNSDKVYISYLFTSNLLKHKTPEFYKYAMNPGLYSNRGIIESSKYKQDILDLLPKQSYQFQKLEEKYSPEGEGKKFELHFFCCQLGRGNFRRNLAESDNISCLEDLQKLDMITKFEKMTMNLEGLIREFLRYGKAVPKYGA